MKLKMQTKIVKNGNGYALAIPKGYVDCKTLQKGKRYNLIIEEVKNAVTGYQPPNFINFENVSRNKGLIT